MLEELQADEAEGRRAAAATLDGLRGRYCPRCGLTVTPHCDGCAACPGGVHPWWCLGERCVCGCPVAKHDDKGRCGCQPHLVKDVEYERAYQAWCDCSDEEKASRRALGAAILLEFGLGVGAFDGLDQP